MRDERPVMIIGQHGDGLHELTERVRALGYRTLRAKTAEEAMEIADRRRLRLRAILIEPDPPALDLPRALSALCAQTVDGRRQAVIAAGPAPDAGARTRLREAGVIYGLFGTVGDHTLRFQINRASTDDIASALRQDPRAPTEWSALVHAAGRRKQAGVYSLSAGGAYLATARPSQRGAELAVDLPLPGGEYSVAGRVVYTNVPGNLQRSGLPSGMAIRFVNAPRGVIDEIDRTVANHVDAQRI